MSKTGFWQRLRFKFRISVLNENTLNEVWHIRLSRINAILFVFGLFVVVFALFAAIIWFTPLRNYLPGYNEDIRRELVMEMVRVDSLNQQLTFQQNYLSTIRDVLSGEIASDSLQTLDSMTIVQQEKLMEERSPITSEFIAQYEAKGLDNLTLFAQPNAVQVPAFFRPAHGVIMSHFNAQAGKYGISIVTPANENIVSVLPGTVIYTSRTMDNEWMMIVQHGNDYLSLYRHLKRLMRQPGDHVQAGESLAIASDKNPLKFELWCSGNAINPEEVIAF